MAENEEKTYDESIEDLIYGENKTHAEEVNRMKKKNALLSNLNEGLER